MLRGLYFGFRFGEVVLEGGTGKQLADNGLPQHSPGINVSGEMLANEHAVPANVAANLQNGGLLFREELGQQQGLNRPAGRMPARIAVTRLRLSQGEVLVQLVWAEALPVVLRDVDGHANVLFHLLEQGFGLGKPARLEERSDGGREQED